VKVESGSVPSPPPSAVILAAGRSSRMGRCKALLPWGDRTLLAAWIERFIEAGAAEVAVVLGAEFELVRQEVASGLADGARVRWVQNRTPDSTGPRESLLIGLDSLPADAPAWFTPVDVPVVRVATLTALQEAWHAAASQTTGGVEPLAALPRHRGKQGHPVFGGPSFIQRLFQGEPGDRIDELLSWATRRLAFADVDDPRVLVDMDDMAAYQREAPPAGGPDPVS
jgi:molybdenum cofactor cytidylyltransferase